MYTDNKRKITLSTFLTHVQIQAFYKQELALSILTVGQCQKLVCQKPNKM